VAKKAILFLVLLASCASAPERGIDAIETVVVIYAENRSFDHLYGLFPGAEGIAAATAEQKTQLDHDGTPLAHLPPVYLPNGKPDPMFPQALPNGPFRIDQPPVNGRLDQLLPTPIHKNFRQREQMNDGKNNKFVAMSDTGAWAMGYFDGSKMRLWRWAKEYVLADHFFQGALGDSFINHQWLICACTPRDETAPANARPRLDERGNLVKLPGSPRSVLEGPVRVADGRVTEDGYAVSASQPSYQPSGFPPAAGGDLNYADPALHPLPPQTSKTIGDTLSAKGISWAWYGGAWNLALADGRRAPSEKRTVIYSAAVDGPYHAPHHQPFNYFARFAPGTADRATHLKDYEDLVAAIDKGTLPQVVFYKPDGRRSQHPGSTDVVTGDEHISTLLERLSKSPQWKRMAIIITYDENGGFWDHVPPPHGPGWSDRWGPGTRVPAIIVSPFARRGQIDKTIYDTTSVIKFLTRRFGLEPLPGVRANVGDLSNAFAF
jgi:acid phosphatase